MANPRTTKTTRGTGTAAARAKAAAVEAEKAIAEKEAADKAAVEETKTETTEVQALAATQSADEVSQDSTADDADVEGDDESEEASEEEVKDETPETPEQPKVAPTEDKDLGNGVVLKTPVDEGVRNQTLEGFLLSKYNLTPENYSEALKRTIRGFETYHANMNARVPVQLEEAAKHQAAWLRTIAGALDGAASDSNICFDVILHLAYRHQDDLFSDRLACRAFNLMPASSRDLFTLYQTIIVNAANPRNRVRYIKSQLNLTSVGNAIRSENQRRNLLSFLSAVE